MPDITVAIDPNIKGKLTHYNGVPVDNPDKTPVLIQNSLGSYKFVPKAMAEKMEKEHEAIIMRPTDPDYLAGFKAAWGHFEGVKPSETIQFRGKLITPEQIGRLDFKAALEEAEKEVAEAGGPDGGIVAAKDMPEGVKAFGNKLRNRQRRQFKPEA